jgi:hypothetical protein
MALTKKIEIISNFGDTVVFNNALIKVVNISGGKENMNIYVYTFKDKDKDKDKIIIKEDAYSFTPNLESEDNFIKQAYLYLKTLPEYADAIDC